MSTEEQIDDYCNFYEQQHGGSYPVFAGLRYQRGNGIGDFLKGLARDVIPVALRGAAEFSEHVSEKLADGVSFKEAAKGSIAPTLASVIEKAAASLASKSSKQTGNGVRKQKHVYKASKHISKTKRRKLHPAHENINF